MTSLKLTMGSVLKQAPGGPRKLLSYFAVVVVVVAAAVADVVAGVNAVERGVGGVAVVVVAPNCTSPLFPEVPHFRRKAFQTLFQSEQKARKV